MNEKSEGVEITDYRLEKLESRVTAIEQRFDAINNWLRGILGSVVVALILLVFDLLKGR